MKIWRMAVLTVLLTALANLPALALAPVSPDVTQERFSVPFTIPFGVPCADLPPGVSEISGVAEFFVRTTARVDKDGVLHLNINATAFGNATDNNGETYSFNYANHFSVDVPPNEFPQQFRVTDHFNLNGKGKASHMHLGFVVVGTAFGPNDVVTDTINIRGDAFNCDPI
jgi:hypothetical protein